MSDSNGSAGKSFATYLAKHYIARKGYRAGTVPEAAALASACDIVLTLTTGFSMAVICIVDREAHPERTFGLSRDALDQIGQACLKYSGTVSGSKMPVTFQVMEIGPGPLLLEDRLRLESFKRTSLRSKVMLSAWKLDTTAGTAWTNAPFGGFLLRRPIERLLRAPRIVDADLRPPAIELARDRFPLLTVAMLAVLAAIFACELIYGVEPWSGLLAPNIQTLVALGGLNKTLVLQSGEWYRIFSAMLLHGDVLHLALNGFCLYLAGTVLESFVGRRWFFALFVIGGVCGSLMSLALNPASVVSVGASGAIMGLLAAAFVCSFRYPAGGPRMQIQMTTLQVLIPSLIPLAVSRTGQHIDFAAHLGGALSGALVGWAMLKTWSPASSRPAFLPAATVLCAGGAVALALSFLPVVRDYRTDALGALLMPSEQLPKSNAEAKMKAADLVARYPRDPRAHLYQAGALIDRNDLAGAERELRAGLAEKDLLKTRFTPELEARMGGMLALVLNERNQRPEATAAAQPACATTDGSLAALRDLLVKSKLCGK
jgi:rhomboid protease GluP